MVRKKVKRKAQKSKSKCARTQRTETYKLYSKRLKFINPFHIISFKMNLLYLTKLSSMVLILVKNKLFIRSFYAQQPW